MRKLSLLLFAIPSIGILSCKKDIYGCTDPTAKNYSTYANVDDGSCYKIDNIESDIITITSWGYSSPSYYAVINYPAINQDVIDNGAVLVYIETTSGQYSQLPLTFYPSSSYSSSLETVHSLNQVTVFWTDSDLTQPNNPGNQTIKIVVIQNKAMVKDKKILRDLHLSK